jgi:predicted  nucleic acid-binding Zn-ribbon protein
MAVAEEEISGHETRMLERMEEADTIARDLKAADAALKAEQAAVLAERARLDQEQAAAERELEAVLAERATLTSQISREAFALFERICQNRKGIAVAEARDGLCTVCHVRLRPQVFNEVRRNDSIIQCESCTRILYFVPSAASGAAPQPS